LVYLLIHYHYISFVFICIIRKFQWIGSREHLQESLIFDGYGNLKPWLPVDFPGKTHPVIVLAIIHELGLTHTETWQYPEDLAVPPHFVCPDSVDEARRDGIHRDPCRFWAEKTTWEGCKTFESWENLPSRLIEATHVGFFMTQNGDMISPAIGGMSPTNINFTDFQQQTLAGLWLQPLNLKHMLVIGDHHPISRVFRTHL